MPTTTKTVVYAATRNLYRQVLPCINSVIQNGNVDEIILLIEDNHFQFDDLPIQTINVSKQPWFNPKGVNFNSRWTYMVMMKVALSKILYTKEKALLLDCDTIVEHDLSPLWDIDMTDYYFGAVKQKDDGRGGAFTKGDYFNTGVLMCNLAKLRDGMDDTLIYRLNTHYYQYVEQDCISTECEGKIYALKGRWNSCDFNEEDTERYITHFAAQPDWRNTELGRKYDL